MATSRRSLRAVDPDEKAKKRPPRPLTDVVETGTYREILEAQRREIAASLPTEKGPAKAALHRQLSLISKELEALAAVEVDNDQPKPDEPFDYAAI